MDNLDRAILSFLQKDGRKPYTEIAQALNVTEGTVRNRVGKLIEEQAVHIVGMVDPYQLGFDAPALIGVSAQPVELDHAAAEEVSWVYQDG